MQSSFPAFFCTLYLHIREQAGPTPQSANYSVDVGKRFILNDVYTSDLSTFDNISQLVEQMRINKIKAGWISVQPALKTYL